MTIGVPKATVGPSFEPVYCGGSLNSFVHILAKANTGLCKRRVSVRTISNIKYRKYNINNIQILAIYSLLNIV